MAQTLNDIAYSIFETARANIKDDDTMDIRLIKEWIHDARAMLVKQQLDKSPYYIDNSYIQDYGDVELSLVDSTLHSDFDLETYILRSDSQIPEPITYKANQPVLIIGSTDILANPGRYTTRDWEGFIHSGNGRFNSKTIYATYRDGYIYIRSKESSTTKGIRYVNVRGVFQKPTDVTDFTDGSSNYPVNRKLRDAIEKIILTEKFGFPLIDVEDKSNNTSHELERNA